MVTLVAQALHVRLGGLGAGLHLRVVDVELDGRLFVGSLLAFQSIAFLPDLRLQRGDPGTEFGDTVRALVLPVLRRMPARIHRIADRALTEGPILFAHLVSFPAASGAEGCAF